MCRIWETRDTYFASPQNDHALHPTVSTHAKQHPDALCVLLTFKRAVPFGNASCEAPQNLREDEKTSSEAKRFSETFSSSSPSLPRDAIATAIPETESSSSAPAGAPDVTTRNAYRDPGVKPVTTKEVPTIFRGDALGLKNALASRFVFGFFEFDFSEFSFCVS